MDLADGRGRVSSEVVIGQTSPGEWGCVAGTPTGKRGNETDLSAAGGKGMGGNGMMRR